MSNQIDLVLNVMKMKKLILLACLVVGFASCSSDDGELSAPEMSKYEPIELTVAEQVAAESVTSFGVSFFNHVSQRNASGNLVVSPLSVSLNLSMLANASHASFQAEFAEIMGCSDIDALNSLNGKLCDRLPTLDRKATLSLANSLWYPTRYSLNSSFVDVVDSYYGLDTFCRDLGSESTRNELNSWASNKTNGLIDQLDIPMTDATEFVLANALYFKAPWRGFTFDADKTDKAVFHGVDGDVSVDMMHASRNVRYAEGDNYRVVEDLLGNSAFIVTFVLPAEGCTVEDLADDYEDILLGEKEVYQCKLSLPRVKLTMPRMLDVTSELKEMGLRSLGCGGYTFFDQPLTSNDPLLVLQKTALEFNEAGAEAASTTVSTLFWSNTVKGTEITFDRPYAFFIRQADSNVLLFAGRVSGL